MSDGPRDWSPPGYWDDSHTASAARARVRGRSHRTDSPRTVALVSVMFGLFSVAWPLCLASPHPGLAGWAMTTSGLTAVVFAFRSKHAGGGSALPMIGATLGVIGTVLCVWSMLAFYDAGVVPAAPSLRTFYTSQSSPVAGQALPLAPAAAAVAPAASRVVPPFETADVTAPTQQLRANLRHVIFSLAPALMYERDHGELPSSLSVDPNGLIRSPGATYSTIAPYMALTYGIVAGPAGFTLTVTDTVSTMAESVDPVTRQLIDR